MYKLSLAWNWSPPDLMSFVWTGKIDALTYLHDSWTQSRAIDALWLAQSCRIQPTACWLPSAGARNRNTLHFCASASQSRGGWYACMSCVQQGHKYRSWSKCKLFRLCRKWNQRDAVQQVFYCTLVGSTCFGCRRHPSSGAQYVQSRSVGTMCVW